jgi:hypothetical protein
MIDDKRVEEGLREGGKFSQPLSSVIKRRRTASSLA